MSRTFLILSAVINLLIVLFTVFASVCMFKGIRFMSGSTDLSSTYWKMFKYFTIDSNVLMGICALIFLGYEIACLTGSLSRIPDFCYTLKLMGTVSVTLTFLVVIFFLAPFARHGYLSMFKDSNLFFHLITPVLSIIVFIMEKTETLDMKDALISMIPMLIYAVWYAVNALSHVEEGKVSYHYDFYGFLSGGVYMAVPVIVIIAAVTFVTALGLIRLNKCW